MDQEGNATDDEVNLSDVYQEFDVLRRKNNIEAFNSKVVSRKYAFEIDDVPEEAEYLKVVYPYSRIIIF